MSCLVFQLRFMKFNNFIITVYKGVMNYPEFFAMQAYNNISSTSNDIKRKH